MPSVFLLRARQSGRSWTGLIFSTALHLILITVAGWWVLSSRTMTPRPPEPECFVTASGSAPSSGLASSSYAVNHPPKAHRSIQRIAVNLPSSTVALPSFSSPEASIINSQSLVSSIGGGGKGRGLSFGSLVGQRHFMGRPVLGASIQAQRVAVYLDCSGSMRPYLQRVTQEIKSQYPDADIFQFDGARIVALEDVVVYGKRFRGNAPKLTEAPSPTVETELTEAGKQLFRQLRSYCEKGSLGAWLDRVLGEPYDALVVFSDFQDGVRVYDESDKRAPKLVYSDSTYRPVGTQLPPGLWQKRWLEVFRQGAKGKGPKLYLFSIQQSPQAFLQACVEASGGASVDVSWLRSTRRSAKP